VKNTVTITGIDDMNRMLESIAPRQAKNIMRATIHGVAAGIAKDAKTFMRQDTGTMKRATKAKRERQRGAKMASTVRVGREAYYWRFEEYGQGPDGVESAMFLKATTIFQGEMDRIFVEQFGKKFEAALARARKKAG